MITRCLKAFLIAAAIAIAAPAIAQDRPDGCVIEQWPGYLSPEPQEFKMRERLETDAGEIWAIEFGPLAGEYAKLYLFFLVYGDCERKVFSVGSYNYLTEFARESGDIGPEARRYHLDLYEPELHSTLHDTSGLRGNAGDGA